MWNEPTQKQLDELPTLYSTDHIPLENKLIHMHFFLRGCDWYAAEYDDLNRLFFGYAILNSDLENAEWGNFSYEELRSIRTRQGIEVDRDLHWEPKQSKEIPDMCYKPWD